ncbi:DinB family protein [Streptomyces sp. SID14478]|uniref:DinB family protein n=1 Tax=Streptomyces sp. SID14478 TaxID=2706073 RepID=UPI0013DB46F3|nr:DinB family protein [Streptomyces sp. SID14478]NEB80081.1 DinB family protein [Streptomyces sp. SID14478]
MTTERSAPAVTRRVELFPGAASEARFTTPATGDERRMLAGFLTAQRATLELKCTGLERELATASVDPSTLSLLGLVRHLTDVERRWFRRTIAGQDAPNLYSTPDNPEGDFDDVHEADPAAVWDAWRAETAFADQLLSGAADLDVEGTDAWRGTVSLRWVVVHMIEGYARHNGHADLLRERIDGRVGA